jgi:hypothetical protein
MALLHSGLFIESSLEACVRSNGCVAAYSLRDVKDFRSFGSGDWPDRIEASVTRLNID